jgi:phage terminase small subunit
MPLNPKHEAVALAYIADPEKIGWRAYRKVYPKSSRHAAETAWARLLKNAEFSARVAEVAQAAVQGAVMTAQEVLSELSKIGRTNMADFVRAFACGDPVMAVDQLTPEQTAALGEVIVEQFMDGAAGEALEDQAHGGALKRWSGREVRRIKFKLIAKTPALELLGKHHKLYVERHEHDFGAGVAERLAAAIARADGRKSADGRTEKQSGKVRKEVRPHRDPPRKRDARKAPRKGKRARA